MGKNLRGRELGKGLSQRKDKRYSARFVDKTGQRQQKYFDSLAEARNWLNQARLEDENTGLTPFEMVAEKILKSDDAHIAFKNMTVDEWYEFWMENIIANLAWNTRRNYRDRYLQNIQPVIGKLKIQNVRPMHCQKIIQNMDKDYAGSTIRQAYIAMGTMFKSALMNDVISKHPLDGVRCTKPARSASDIKYLTIKEQEAFLRVAKRSHNYNQYCLILETGLRTGEMIGLTWDAVDFERRTLTVNKTLEYRHSRGTWKAGPPKTASSYRTIPLTDRAYEILEEEFARKKYRKQSPELSTTLEYVDRISGQTKILCMEDLVFINYRLGMPEKNSSYDTHLYKLCDEAGIKRFCMHALRHTYATRAIERGVNPKTLQLLLGHSTLSMTMDRYVHVTDDSKWEAVRRFEMKDV